MATDVAGAHRPLCVGFSAVTRIARFGEGSLEVTVDDRPFVLTGNVLRLIDLYHEQWRREAHEERLLPMHGGNLGQTLCDACAAGGLRDATFLLARGADVFYLAEEVNARLNQTTIELAAHGGHTAVVDLLLTEFEDRLALSEAWPISEPWRDDDDGDSEYVADEEWVEVRKECALSWACLGGHTAVACLLLANGVDVNHENGTPLCNAAQEGHLDTARMLIQRGAHATAAAVQEGLYFARQRGHLDMIALLQEHGAQGGHGPVEALGEI